MGILNSKNQLKWYLISQLVASSGTFFFRHFFHKRVERAGDKLTITTRSCNTFTPETFYPRLSLQKPHTRVGRKLNTVCAAKM